MLCADMKALRLLIIMSKVFGREYGVISLFFYLLAPNSSWGFKTFDHNE